MDKCLSVTESLSAGLTGSLFSTNLKIKGATTISKFSNKVGDIRKYLKNLSCPPSCISRTRLKSSPCYFLLCRIGRIQNLSRYLFLFRRSLILNNIKINNLLQTGSHIYITSRQIMNYDPNASFYCSLPQDI